MHSVQETKPTISLSTARLFAGCCLLLLLIPGLMALGSKENQSAKFEKRNKAERPAVPSSWAEWKAFPTQFQAFFEDHFGFREELVQSQQYLLWKVWGVPTLSTESSQTTQTQRLQQAAAAQLSQLVLIGKEGWLYYKADHVLEDARGLRPFSKAELENWTQAFEQNRKWLASQNIEYLVVFAPNKHSIYPEFLPEGLSLSESTRRLVQLRHSLTKNTDVAFLDLTTQLRKAKNDQRCFHRTDTHWNDSGAYSGYAELCRVLHQIDSRFPVAKPVSEIRFNQSLQPGKDLAVMMGLSNLITEESINLEAASLHPSTAKQQQAGELGTGTVRKYVNMNRSLPKVMLVHDSFSLAWMDWLAEHCSELTADWTLGLNRERVEKEKPQIVIHQIVERMLPVRSAAELINTSQ